MTQILGRMGDGAYEFKKFGKHSSNKPNILVIHTGGTIGQELQKRAVYEVRYDRNQNPAYVPIDKGKETKAQEAVTIAKEKGATVKKTTLDMYVPSNKEYLHLVPGIGKLANITTLRTANVDSTNMETIDRVVLANIVYQNRLNYDGFVIVHGTDTMADSAAAMTYMIQNLGKPIIFTGSQKPIFKDGTDAIANMYNAMDAATADIGEVAIVFGDRVIRGTRATKVNEQGTNAFDSPRVKPIGELGLKLILDTERVRRYRGDARLFMDFETGIEYYGQTSGTDTQIFSGYVDNPGIKGIIIGGFGAGNVQNRLMASIKAATEKGKPVVVVTNCLIGAADMNMYSVGVEPLLAGAISARDMTLEASIQKLMYAVGRTLKEFEKGCTPNVILERVKHYLYIPIGKDISDERNLG